ncbi:MAG: lipid-A-disaccharide synthase [Flavobacteriia bacterium]|nr:lipid-A-disaccharide synthase [Flavobacteriia bacterium]
MTNKRVFIICGEPSGDLHAANLVNAWKKKDASFAFKAWGGDRLIAEEVEVLKHVKDLSFMGFVEVLKHFRTIMRNFKECKATLTEFDPHTIILVDFPGFNLRIAKWAKERNIKVVYYISPQIWAWKQGRIHQIKKYVDEMYCILPFEPAFYERFQYPVHYFGHPLLDEVKKFRDSSNTLDLGEKPVMAILPGSRIQEVRRKLPVMLAAAQSFTDFQLVIACTPQIPESFYKSFASEHVKLVFGQTYEVLKQAKAALVTSGTATLETALFRVPQVVCYKSNWLSYLIAKQVVKVKYISLVNLILDTPLVKELIQHECNVENISKELYNLTHVEEYKNSITMGYDTLISRLGESGASERIANRMIETF